MGGKVALERVFLQILLAFPYNNNRAQQIFADHKNDSQKVCNTNNVFIRASLLFLLCARHMYAYIPLITRFENWRNRNENKLFFNIFSNSGWHKLQEHWERNMKMKKMRLFAPKLNTQHCDVIFISELI
jgi:hypothetical protein